MARSWIEIARRIQEKPWNRPGTDKTWVLNALSQHRLFAQEVRNARRVAARSTVSSPPRARRSISRSSTSFPTCRSTPAASSR